MKTVVNILLGVLIFAIIGFGGDIERIDYIIYTMEDNIYNEIKDSLSCHGKEPSDRQIANFYVENYCN